MENIGELSVHIGYYCGRCIFSSCIVINSFVIDQGDDGFLPNPASLLLVGAMPKMFCIFEDVCA